MTTTVSQQDDDGSVAGVPPEVLEAAAEHEADQSQQVQAPEWLDRFIWASLWKVVAVVAAVALTIIVATKAQHLIAMLVVSLFFAMAMTPAVDYLHDMRGWRPGAAVGAIYGILVLFVAVMVLLLIPAIGDFAGQVGDHGDDWIAGINNWTEDQFGVTAIDVSSTETAATTSGSKISGWTDKILGVASSGLGLLFDLATIGLFTFYLAADNVRIRRALLSRMPPQRQRVYTWVLDTAVQQTGGYFYSRLLLMLLNGGLFFVVMVAVGVPVSYAVPLSLFEGFVAEFIPAVGTYIGAAVPILVTLGDQGLVPALILLGWTLVYQQIENYWLSPKLSSRTMELNGGIAFGAAIAGAAIAGPMGAFMALPVAALITAVITNAARAHDLADQSAAGRSPADVAQVDGGTGVELDGVPPV